MWELDHKESWVPKSWCFWSVVLEKTLESPLANKEIKPVNPKGNEPWIFIGRTFAEVEAPILWPSGVKSQLTAKNLMLGKIEGRSRRGWQNEMVGWYHQLNGHEFEQIPGENEGETWRAAVHGVAKSLTLSDWTATIGCIPWVQPEAVSYMCRYTPTCVLYFVYSSLTYCMSFQ